MAQNFLKSFFFEFFKIFPLFLFANPQGGEVTEGAVNISVQDKNNNNHLIISQDSEKAIIQWQEFSIANGEKTEFNF